MYQNKILKLVTDVMPDSCHKCEAAESKCKLPMKAYPRDEEIKREYVNKRHKDCPLIILEGKEE
jgi:hypothetical protein